MSAGAPTGRADRPDVSANMAWLIGARLTGRRTVLARLTSSGGLVAPRPLTTTALVTAPLVTAPLAGRTGTNRLNDRDAGRFPSAGHGEHGGIARVDIALVRLNSGRQQQAADGALLIGRGDRDDHSRFAGPCGPA